jgi:DNA-directed RNA polymerase beta' subunit
LTALCKTGSSNKVILPIIYGSPIECIKGLLDGYYSGDGCVTNKSVDCSSVSKSLIDGIQFLLTYFGIFGKVSGHQQKKNNVGSLSIKYTHTLTIRNGFSKIFAEQIPLTLKKKQLRLDKILDVKLRFQFGHNQKNLPHDRDVYFDPITEIEEVDGSEYVYDLTVEHTRNFQIFNGLNFFDTFHSSGITVAAVVTGVPRFKELLNTTKNPKGIVTRIFFKDAYKSLLEIRQAVQTKLVHITLKEVIQSSSITKNKTRPWYLGFFMITGKSLDDKTQAISLHFTAKHLFTNRLTLPFIARRIETTISNTTCIYSPDCLHQVDVWFDTKNYNSVDIFKFLNGISLGGIRNCSFYSSGNEW